MNQEDAIRLSYLQSQVFAGNGPRLESSGVLKSSGIEQRVDASLYSGLYKEHPKITQIRFVVWSPPTPAPIDHDLLDWSQFAPVSLPNEEAEAPEWLKEVYTLVQRNMPDQAIDLLFREIDDLLLEDNFEDCDQLLKAIELERLDTNLFVALLSITRPAASKLRFRSELVQGVEHRIRETDPDRLDGLLYGLR